MNEFIIVIFLNSKDETSNEGLVVDVDGPVSSSDFRNSRLPSQFGEPPKVARLGQHFTFGTGTGVRMRPSVRGTSKRGRPRGSRRGGPVGGKGRGMLLLHPPSIKNSVSSGHLSPSSSPSHSSSVPSDSNPQYGEYPSVVFLPHLMLLTQKVNDHLTPAFCPIQTTPPRQYLWEKYLLALAFSEINKTILKTTFFLRSCFFPVISRLN